MSKSTFRKKHRRLSERDYAKLRGEHFAGVSGAGAHPTGKQKASTRRALKGELRELRKEWT